MFKMAYLRILNDWPKCEFKKSSKFLMQNEKCLCGGGGGRGWWEGGGVGGCGHIVLAADSIQSFSEK